VIPTWTGKVTNTGLLKLDQHQDYARYLWGLKGQFIELVLRTRKERRSSKANARYWGYVVPAIAEATGYTNEEAHEALKHHLLKEPGDGPLVKVRSTASLSVEEFSAYTERCQVLGAEMFGIEWES
jgi:hypothetical protein